MRKPRVPRQRRNVSEVQFSEIMKAKGFEVTKRGWPDFICFREDGTFMAVEVKRAGHHKLRLPQERIMRALGKLGVECYRWDPYYGLQELE